MRRHHTIVVVARRDERRGVADAFADVVQRRVGVERAELRRIVARTVFGRPAPADGEKVVAQHVHHADRRQADGEQVGALHFAGTHQQSAVRAAGDGQLFARGILLGDEEFGRRDEIVEDLLLAVEHTSLVPPLAVFRTAAQVDVHHHAALLHEEDVLGLERRGDIDLETAVAVEVTGIAGRRAAAPGDARRTSARARRRRIRRRAVR